MTAAERKLIAKAEAARRNQDKRDAMSPAARRIHDREMEG